MPPPAALSWTMVSLICFSMDIPVDEPRFIRRMQVSLDDARVLHHVILHHDPSGSSAGMDAFDCDAEGVMTGDTRQLWAWAPGTGSLDFEERGLEIGPGERMVVEIHDNNGAGLSDVVDSSGKTNKPSFPHTLTTSTPQTTRA